MKKIGFVGIHPGSANSLFPIIDFLKKEDKHEVHLFPFSEYAMKLWGTENHYNLNNFDYSEMFPSDLDIVFYSAGSLFDVENNLPIYCKENGITSVSTIDVFWTTMATIEARFPNLPDYIIAPNEELYMELSISEKFKTNILPFGNPHFEFILDNHSERAATKNKKLDVSFISVPRSNDLMDDTSDISVKILDSLATYVRTHDNINKVYLCKHPRETLVYFNYFLDANADIADKFVINPFPKTSIACEYSDIILGDQSTVLYEQVLNGKSVIFYKSYTELEKLLKNPNSIPPFDFEVPPNSLKHIITFFELF